MPANGSVVLLAIPHCKHREARGCEARQPAAGEKVCAPAYSLGGKGHRSRHGNGGSGSHRRSFPMSQRPTSSARFWRRHYAYQQLHAAAGRRRRCGYCNRLKPNSAYPPGSLTCLACWDDLAVQPDEDCLDGAAVEPQLPLCRIVAQGPWTDVPGQWSVRTHIGQSSDSYRYAIEVAKAGQSSGRLVWSQPFDTRREAVSAAASMRDIRVAIHVIQSTVSRAAAKPWHESNVRPEKDEGHPDGSSPAGERSAGS